MLIFNSSFNVALGGGLSNIRCQWTEVKHGSTFHFPSTDSKCSFSRLVSACRHVFCQAETWSLQIGIKPVQVFTGLALLSWCCSHLLILFSSFHLKPSFSFLKPSQKWPLYDESVSVTSIVCVSTDVFDTENDNSSSAQIKEFSVLFHVWNIKRSLCSGNFSCLQIGLHEGERRSCRSWSFPLKYVMMMYHSRCYHWSEALQVFVLQ